MLATLHDLNEEAMIDILTKPKNALVKQMARLLEMDGVKLTVTPGALKAVAQRALGRSAGARGLRAILESAMLEVMYELPSKQGVKECLVNEDVILRGEPPLLVYEEEQKQLA
jgi:ATP-dependent Clp protease ATP-binding subunit ClpX